MSFSISLSQNASKVLSEAQLAESRIVASGTPHLVAFDDEADLQDWVEYLFTSMPLSASKNLHHRVRVSLLITL